jgi:ABC-2 type transport system permease protein
MLIGEVLVEVLSKYSWVKYVLFANLDLRLYFDGTPLVEGMTLGFSITVLSVYFLLFNFASFLFFSRRDIA